MKKTVRLLEVGPRDGWQNLGEYIPLEKKQEYIADILAAGLSYLQVTAFVNPKAVPQMRDAAEIAAWAVREYPDRDFCALVPNLKGALRAAECGLKEVNCVMSVSESHNQANIRRSPQESLAGLAEMRRELPDLTITPALGTAFGCPFEGDQPPAKVLDYVARLADMGFTRVELSDTIGAADPVRVAHIFGEAKKRRPGLTLLAHMHDTRNNGILNSWVALENGADVLHSALGGLGGCPFAPGASGNTSTEDLVWILERGAFETGVDFQKLIGAAKKMRREVPGNYSGHHSAIENDAFQKILETGPWRGSLGIRYEEKTWEEH